MRPWVKIKRQHIRSKEDTDLHARECSMDIPLISIDSHIIFHGCSMKMPWISPKPNHIPRQKSQLYGFIAVIFPIKPSKLSPFWKADSGLTNQYFVDFHQVSQNISPHPVFYPSFPRKWLEYKGCSKSTISGYFQYIPILQQCFVKSQWNPLYFVTMKSPCSGARKTWNPHQITLK